MKQYINKVIELFKKDDKSGHHSDLIDLVFTPVKGRNDTLADAMLKKGVLEGSKLTEASKFVLFGDYHNISTVLVSLFDRNGVKEKGITRPEDAYRQALIDLEVLIHQMRDKRL